MIICDQFCTSIAFLVTGRGKEHKCYGFKYTFRVVVLVLVFYMFIVPKFVLEHNDYMIKNKVYVLLKTISIILVPIYMLIQTMFVLCTNFYLLCTNDCFIENNFNILIQPIFMFIQKMIVWLKNKVCCTKTKDWYIGYTNFVFLKIKFYWIQVCVIRTIFVCFIGSNFY